MDPALEVLYPTEHPLIEHSTDTYSVQSFNMTYCLHFFSQFYNHTASETYGFQDILSQIPPYCQQLLLETAAMDSHVMHQDFEFTDTDRASSVIRTVLGIVYSLVMAVCGIGNLLLFAVIFCYKKSRSATNMLISNLCFADFFVAVFCIPLQLDYYVIRNQAWVWGGSMCKVVSFIRMMSLYVSTNTLLVISIDRCLVVRRQFNGKKTRRSVAVVLAVVWTVSALVALPSALYAKIHPQQNGNNMFCGQAWPVSQMLAYKAYFMFLMMFILFYLYSRSTLSRTETTCSVIHPQQSGNNMFCGQAWPIHPQQSGNNMFCGQAWPIHPQQNGNNMFCGQAWPVSQMFSYKAYFMFLMMIILFYLYSRSTLSRTETTCSVVRRGR
ncbi:prolactin-releasing peptide receptor-like [Branchiostoma floridae x Branchiostoma japonicum]